MLARGELGKGETLDTLSSKIVGVRRGKPLARGVLSKVLRGIDPIAGLASQIAALTQVPLWCFFEPPGSVRRATRPRVGSKRRAALMGPKSKRA